LIYIDKDNIKIKSISNKNDLNLNFLGD